MAQVVVRTLFTLAGVKSKKELIKAQVNAPHKKVGILNCGWYYWP